MRYSKISRLLLYFIIWTASFLLIFACIETEFAYSQNIQVDTSTKLPTITYTDGQKQVETPDWSKVSFSSFPTIEQSGWIDLPQDLVNALKYDPSRVWQAGTSVDALVQLGDLKDRFHLEAFSLKDISDLTGLALKNVKLNDFGIAELQTPLSLVRAVPQLANLSIDSVAPLKDLLKLSKGLGNGTISQVLQQNPVFGSLSLGKLDLSQYNLQSIPGLSQAFIGKFAGWQQSFISDIPGLNLVPFGQFPVPFLSDSISFGRTDVTFSDAEFGDSTSPPDLYISGSIDRKGKTVPVPCDPGKPCSYIEITDPFSNDGSLHGKRWVSGLSQKVKGGFGLLAKINGGWEPTGIKVYPGVPFKVVLMGVDETKGTAKFALYFNFCANFPFIGKSCASYFIGPIPWFSTREKGLIVVASTSQPNVKIPAKYQARINKTRQQYEPQRTTNTSEVISSTSLCGQGPGGIDFPALADATSSIEGNYNSVGQWGCDGAGNCGRGLGRYQLMTYRSDVRSAITSQPGGSDFYTRLQAGYNPSTAELNRYFSPQAQDRLFVTAQTQNINRLLRRGKSGDELVACLGQMWYSGTCSNSSGRDYTGGPTIREYGQRLVRSYHQALAKSNKNCATSATKDNTSQYRSQQG
ncbi:MAG: hypothetical protein CLLPBCKN_007219 [Chroococcidiopsis cubana SAG 39.79]|uniref:Uncharacterized protein n=1 Tax=Chroococcidiopsis cubana SAG 39.79 TaxID=388085 RepID=A0AB37URH0_9CYAN|nr:hypothetical protein [Chroococcidiopsis cubana]MDZ4877784.1 hypothetical protein [Chroococcidiopsis cubana SAG 39.79]PSB66618.1 hypothetical protein C7B79_00175 [Chroococcidiopsis cubana CCALA 043]PSB66649.1 hypothetical protein C7B79_00330 [Chroococcidiopsis cubana CCALA 043]RUT14064.1 hypothetical protein DSM107010_05470 [Chroococcidiopsis cubana SAG 39.79]